MCMCLSSLLGSFRLRKLKCPLMVAEPTATAQWLAWPSWWGQLRKMKFTAGCESCHDRGSFFSYSQENIPLQDCMTRKAYLSITRHLGRKCIFILMTQLPLSWRLNTMGSWGLSTFTFLSLKCLLPPYPVTSCPVWSFLGLEYTTQRYYQQRNLVPWLKMRVNVLSCNSKVHDK